MVWTDVNTAIKYFVDIFQSLTLMHDPLNPNIPGTKSTISYWCIENLGWVGWTAYLCIFQTRTWYLQKYNIDYITTEYMTGYCVMFCFNCPSLFITEFICIMQGPATWKLSHTSLDTMSGYLFTLTKTVVGHWSLAIRSALKSFATFSQLNYSVIM